MKARELRWFLLGYLALLFVAMSLRSNETVGISANSVNSNYDFEAGAPPWSIAFGVVGAGLYIALLFVERGEYVKPMPHLLRRWLAGLIDWIWALLVPAFVPGLIAILLEYRKTGVFEWVVERQEPQHWDIPLAFAGILATMLVMMPAYCAFCWARGKPTPGSCIFGYRIAPDDGSRLNFWMACLRALLGGMALLGWPCWILAAFLKRDKLKGQFWLDAIFDTHAEFFS